MSCRLKSCHVMLRYDMLYCDVQCCGVHGCWAFCNTSDACHVWYVCIVCWACLCSTCVFLIVYVIHVLYVFHNVLCVMCDTSVVIDFRGFVQPPFVVTEATKQRSSLPQLTVDTCTKSQRHSKLNVLTVK